jgi:hypothetical protein
MSNACARASGFCLQGDFVEPQCPGGYGVDNWALEEDPEACGLGVCCTPCPDSSDPRVEYVSDSPQECATIDFDCLGDDRPFNNACGCGCIHP